MIENIYSIVCESKTIYKTDQTAERHKITSSFNASSLFKTLIGDDIEVREVFYIMLLNRANDVLAVQRISEGSQSGTTIDMRIILKSAIDLLAHGVILCHNHPSGNLKPSQADAELTRKVNKALELVDIKLLDHIIISPSGNFYSMKDNLDI